MKGHIGGGSYIIGTVHFDLKLNFRVPGTTDTHLDLCYTGIILSDTNFKQERAHFFQLLSSCAEMWDTLSLVVLRCHLMDLGPGMQKRGQEHAALREERDIYCNWP